MDFQQSGNIEELNICGIQNLRTKTHKIVLIKYYMLYFRKHVRQLLLFRIKVMEVLLNKR